MTKFKIKSKFKPSGDQPQAIEKLAEGIKSGQHDQVLLGVTGSGKTFTVANVIAKTQKPTIVIAHNKTLAAQLTQEFREFFPDNAVEYFVSYYDYYQPEAYLPTTDTYIEKEATVNEEIDRLRNSATQSILSRDDVIVVASVSCIYGLGSPEYYQEKMINITVGEKIARTDLMRQLLDLQYTRSEAELTRGTFRPRAETLEIMPANVEQIYQINFENDQIVQINILHKINRNILEKLKQLEIFPAKHYIVPQNILQNALKEIEKELEERLEYFRKNGKIIEAERLSRRTRYDLEMIREVGYCNGIENYSRFFERRAPGSAPYTLLDYFEKRWGKDYLMVIDESHVTVPQIGGMFEGDKSRKDALVEYGFRLPSARDNRPLKFNEFEKKMPQTIYTSATPAKFEIGKARGDCPRTGTVPWVDGIIEQIVRPTGLVDPEVILKPTQNQIEDLMREIESRVAKGERALVTTLTKKMAEDLTSYLSGNAEGGLSPSGTVPGVDAKRKFSVRYLHSDVETLERITILRELREGKFDVLVGVNLLREGLDLPEVSLVAILDADKEGFLRSEVSLIQTIGRAARNVNGKVIMYADNITGSMKRALDETARRRQIQIEYNKVHHITPKTIEKEIKAIVERGLSPSRGTVPGLDLVEQQLSEVDLRSLIKQKELEMKSAAQDLRFEEAAIIRDQLIALKKSARFFRQTR